MIKKVVIAAAGQGTRMLELSKDKSKHLIEVESKPFLSYLIDNLLKADYRDLILVAGFKEELMQNFVENYDPPSPIKKGEYNITLISQYEVLGPKEKEYGTACPVKCVKDMIENHNFIYLYGDNLFSIRDLKKMNNSDEYNYVGGIKNEHPEKYGVLITDDGFLKKIVEKPKEFVGDIINAGIYKFTPEVFAKIDLIKKSPRGEYEVTDAITLLAEEGKVKVQKIKDYWLDFGNPDDIKKVAQFLASDANH